MNSVVGGGDSRCKCEDGLPFRLNHGVSAVSCHCVCSEVKLPIIFIPSCKLPLFPIPFSSEILNRGTWRILGLMCCLVL